MFSPDVATNGHSLRPKRTRAAGDDSLKLPQAKRKRSALRRDTFEPLSEASVNEVAGRQNAESFEANRHAADTKGAAQSVPQSTQLTLRGGKKAEKRTERGATSLLLSSNDFYTVAQLPSLPETIRNRPNLPYTCLLSAEHGYALALTHADALMWPYNISSSIPSARDITSFRLPLPPSTADDPLPLAAFTAKDASGEPGLVVVSPKWGKIVYWESITNASTIIPGQASNGVQGSIPGLSSGETIKEIVNAEPSGYILTSNQGRVAHLSVRDQMGRPAIGVQFLRKPPSSNGNAFFGSIRNALVGDRRRGTPIVHAGVAAKGQRTVVVMTEDGALEEWDTNLTGGNSLKSHCNLKDAILESLATSSALRENITTTSLHFNVLDFQLGSFQHELARRGSNVGFPVILLVALSSEGSRSQYYLLEATVAGPGATVKVTHPIKCYTDTYSGSRRPNLCIAKAQELAIVVFETAIVLFSLAKVEESPTSQILKERHELPDPFQDAIRFQEDAIYKILGHTQEDYDQKAALLLAVQGFGIIRIVCKLQTHEDSEDEVTSDTVSAKSKIEQAVCFGTMKQNPLDLSRGAEDDFSATEIEEAAMAISSEILASSSKYLPKSMPSIDQQMKQRAKALDDLITHLMKQYRAKISRDLLYQLLWNAEKLAAAQALWKVQEDIQRRYPLADREMCYLDFCLRALHESRQKYPNDAKGEKDRVRFWLYNSIEKIHFLLIELVDCFSELEDMDVTDPRVVGEYMKEAMDLWIAAYTAAFKFREDNAQQYGLGDDIFKNGILIAGYPTELGHPWTSTSEVFHYAQRILLSLNKYLAEWYDFNPESKEGKKKKMPTSHEDGQPHDAPPRTILHDIAGKLPALVELFNRLVSEQIIQSARRAQQDPDTAMAEAKVARIKTEKRPFQTGAIMDIRHYNMPGAIELAENLGDAGLLVTLSTEYLRKLTIDAHSDPQHATRYQAKIREVQDKTETYYDRFGKRWAFANFSHMVQNGQLGSVFTTAQADSKKQKFLTWFLKKDDMFGQDLGKMSWINDVVGEQSFSSAEKTLNAVSADEDGNLWNQKTEVSLAKLASLAALEAGEEAAVRTTPADTIAKYSDRMELIQMQEELQSYVDTIIGPALDAKAAEELAIEQFGTQIVGNKPALKRVLKAALHSILSGRPLSTEELVDFLSLSDPVSWPVEPSEDPDICNNELHLALVAVKYSDLPDTLRTALRQLIWRRVFIRDNWELVNDTTNKTDEEVENILNSTTASRTLISLFMDSVASSQPISEIFSPTELVRADVFPEALADRFYGDEKVRKAVLKDLEDEKATLKRYVDKAQLEKHFSGLVARAEEVVRESLDREGEEAAREVLG